MKAFFDTSVLVTAVVDQLPNHEAALACYRRFARPARPARSATGQDVGFCSTHAMAECFATLTALPLERRILPAEALRLVRENFARMLTVAPLSGADYVDALERAGRLGLSSGVIYDILHLRAAERQGCSRLFTYNVADFKRLEPQGVEICTP